MKTSEIADRLGLKQDPTQLYFLAEAGYLWLDLGHQEQSRRIFEALTVLCPADPAGHLGVGEVHLVGQRYRDAITAFKKATQAPCVLIETLAFAYRKLGDAYLMADNPRAALTAWRQVMDIHPDGTDAEQARNKIQCLEQGLTLTQTEQLLEAMLSP